MTTEFKVGQKWLASNDWMDVPTTDTLEVVSVGRVRVSARRVRGGELIAPLLHIDTKTKRVSCTSGAVSMALLQLISSPKA